MEVGENSETDQNAFVLAKSTLRNTLYLTARETNILRTNDVEKTAEVLSPEMGC